MKKIGVLFICVFLVLSFIQLFNAQDVFDGEDFEEKIEEVEDTKEKIEEGIGDIKEGKWEYLGKEWKEILLKKKFVSTVDGFFTKISLVFKILFGEHYSLSFVLFFVVLLWAYFFFKFREIFTDYSSFSSLTATVIGFGFTIILAQFQILRKIIEFFGWLVFTQEANIWRFLILLGIFLGMIFIYYLTSYLGDGFKKSKEKREENKEEMEKKRAREERRIFHKLFEKMMGAFKK